MWQPTVQTPNAYLKRKVYRNKQDRLLVRMKTKIWEHLNGRLSLAIKLKYKKFTKGKDPRKVGNHKISHSAENTCPSKSLEISARALLLYLLRIFHKNEPEAHVSSKLGRQNEVEMN